MLPHLGRPTLRHNLHLRNGQHHAQTRHRRPDPTRLRDSGTVLAKVYGTADRHPEGKAQVDREDHRDERQRQRRGPGREQVADLGTPSARAESCALLGTSQISVPEPWAHCPQRTARFRRFLRRNSTSNPVVFHVFHSRRRGDSRVWHTKCNPHADSPLSVANGRVGSRVGRLFPVRSGAVLPGEGLSVGRFATPGSVYLVGAGPGAADLITVRGLRILQSADVVLHDALISPKLLQEARADAEVVSVGKRGYCVGSTRQETINDALVRLAREGKSVCRLKCGDPCVFGRGGEEAEVLADAGIPFEIVPGVTSATAACAAAGIPLTHRDAGQAVALVTGHHDPDSPDCTLDWEALARLPGIVFYMAARHVAKIAARLSDNGMSHDTPAAVIESATLPAQRVLVGDLRDIGARVEGVSGPAVFVVGEVVARANGRRQPAGDSQRTSRLTPAVRRKTGVPA